MDPQVVGRSDGWKYCQLSWCVVQKWQDKRYLGDEYDASGYVGGGHQMTFHNIDLVDEEPYFQQFMTFSGQGS